MDIVLKFKDDLDRDMFFDSTGYFKLIANSYVKSLMPQAHYPRFHVLIVSMNNVIMNLHIDVVKGKHTGLGRSTAIHSKDNRLTKELRRIKSEYAKFKNLSIHVVNSWRC